MSTQQSTVPHLIIERPVATSAEVVIPFLDNGEGQQFVEQVQYKEENEQEIEVNRDQPPALERQSKTNEMGRGVYVPQQKRFLGLRSSRNGADELLNENRTHPSTHNNVQSYNDDHSATHVQTTTVARPININNSTTVRKGHDMQTAADFASLMKDEIGIGAELDKRQDAADRIASWQLHYTGEVRLNIQDYNDLKRRLEISERPNVCLESSEICGRISVYGWKRN